MDIKEMISSWVDSHRDDFLSDVARLVAIKSVRSDPLDGMPFGAGCAEALQAALDMCAGYGFTVSNYDNAVGTADMIQGETAVDILAHLDVVGEGEGWDTDPYQAVEKDGCLYGRGTDDDKGPAVVALYAMRCVRELGMPVTRNARLIIGTDEESGFSDLPYYYAHNKPAPNTVSPDAEFPVYNTEKGSYKPVFKKSWNESVNTPRVSEFSGGYRINVLPADANARITGVEAAEALALMSEKASEMGLKLRAEDAPGGCKVYVTGKNSHAAHPDDGVNGLMGLIALLNTLPLVDCDSTVTLRQLGEVFPFGDSYGVGAGVSQEDELSGRLTLAFTLMTMDERGFSGQFDSRVPICANEMNCSAVIESRLNAMGFNVEGTMASAHHTPAGTPFIDTLLKSYEIYSGRKGECLSMGGGTYVHDIPGGVAFGASMPGFTSNLHSANERMCIEDALTACKIYAYAIAELCK